MAGFMTDFYYSVLAMKIEIQLFVVKLQERYFKRSVQAIKNKLEGKNSLFDSCLIILTNRILKTNKEEGK